MLSGVATPPATKAGVPQEAWPLVEGPRAVNAGTGLSLRFGKGYGRQMNRAHLLVAASALTLGGCGSNEGYPSLARRPAERYAEAAAAAAVAPVKAAEGLDPATTARITELGNKAREGHLAFLAQRPSVAATVAAAKGAVLGSESWSKASTALALLESKRTPETVALAEIDQIYTNLRVNGGEGSSLAAVRDQITAWVADEDAVLADLRNQIAS